MRPWRICMTVPFFNIEHACPVQRSYELLLRVEILLSHTLFLSTACALISCLLGDLSCWMYHIRILHIIYFSFFLLFLHLFINLPLATRCVIAQGEHTAVSHLVGLNFLLAHIISSGSYYFALLRVFALAFLVGLQPRRLWLNLNQSFVLSWIFFN